MSMRGILAIGTYRDEDRMALERDFDARFIAQTTDIVRLSDSDRQQTRAVAFAGHAPFAGDHMASLPGLELIANFGVGYDAIDVAAASARGIRVTNTPGVLNDDVADLAVALLLVQGREMVQASDWARSGDWAAKGAYPLARKISGGVAGIVGLGRIGREIADRLAAFKCEIHYHSRSAKETPGWTFHDDVVSLARAVDYLIVALVGGPETEGYVSREAISALGPQGIIINISRGSTIDEEAMLEALASGAIAGAGLDVFLNEPRIDPRFRALPNVVIQPHQGSATIQTRTAMGQLQRDNIAAFLAGRSLLTPVN